MTDPYTIIETYLIIDSKRQQGRRRTWHTANLSRISAG